MPKETPIRPRMAVRSTHSFGIVASRYNESFVKPMLDHACAELALLEPGATVHIAWAPGSWEIPVVLRSMLAQRSHTALIALGVIFQGSTGHADLIARTVTSAIMDLSMEKNLPVIHGVLLLENDDQARARCIDRELNRGIEAARAASAVARTIRELSGER
jgi:6,7-dimethyl-8-ribityllumazine synthase